MLQEVRFQVLLLASYALRREGGVRKEGGREKGERSEKGRREGERREEGGRIARYIPKILLTESNCIIF